mmetsp:Transcript_33234/g.50954  ORF Transcript_33234/g.50954 Transcript_33234/m.50954 type:complete len:111 (-) Transcript_33234:377-709(-)
MLSSFASLQRVQESSGEQFSMYCENFRPNQHKSSFFLERVENTMLVGAPALLKQFHKEQPFYISVDRTQNKEMHHYHIIENEKMGKNMVVLQTGEQVEDVVGDLISVRAD